MSERVHVYMADQSGCGWFRLGWPAQMLADDHDIHLFPPGKQEEIEVSEARVGSKRTKVSVKVPKCDVVVFQRPLRRVWPDVIRAFQAQGTRVVVDLDDDFRNVLATHVGYRDVNPRTSPDHNWDHLKTAMTMADRVTVSSDALAERYPCDGGSVVLRNCLPRRFVMTEPGHQRDIPPNRLVVGWAGIVRTHPGDLDSTNGAIGALQRKYGFSIRVIGNGSGVRRALRMNRNPYIIPWQKIEQYHETLDNFDIGIAPLADNKFNEAKSWLKPLEYAARSVPFVASASREYLLFGDEGAGLYASTDKEWANNLESLLTSHERRVELAVRGWEAAQRWIMEDRIDAWRDAWLKW